MQTTVDHVTGSLCPGKPQGANGMDNSPYSSGAARNVPPGRNVQTRHLHDIGA